MSLLVSPVARLAWSKPCRCTKTETSTNIGVVHRKKGNEYGGTKKKNRGKIGGNFRRPLLAKFGANAARSFADHTRGVGGTGVSRGGAVRAREAEGLHRVIP